MGSTGLHRRYVQLSSQPAECRGGDPESAAHMTAGVGKEGKGPLQCTKGRSRG